MIKSDKFKLFQPADCTPKGVTIHFLPNEDYILTYTSQYLDKPIKSNTPKILGLDRKIICRLYLNVPLCIFNNKGYGIVKTMQPLFVICFHIILMMDQPSQ